MAQDNTLYHQTLRWNETIGGIWDLTNPKLTQWSPEPEGSIALPSEQQLRTYSTSWKREVAYQMEEILNHIPGLEVRVSPTIRMIQAKKEVSRQLPVKPGESLAAGYEKMMRITKERGIAKGERTITIQTLLPPDELQALIVQTYEEKAGKPLLESETLEEALEKTRHTGIQLRADFLRAQLGGKWGGSMVDEYDKKTNLPIKRQCFSCSAHHQDEKEYLHQLADWLRQHDVKSEGMERNGYYTLTLRDKDVKKLEKAIDDLLQPDAKTAFGSLQQRVCSDLKIDPGFPGRER